MKKLLLGLVLIGLFIVGCGGSSGGGNGGTGGGTGMEGVVVAFFDEGGNQLTSAATDQDGNFTASVPTDARFFQVVTASINPATHYRHYFYNNKGYTTLEAQCRTPLPTLQNNANISLPGGNIRIPSIQNSPPLPDGCFQAAVGTGSGGTATVRGRVVSF